MHDKKKPTTFSYNISPSNSFKLHNLPLLKLHSCLPLTHHHYHFYMSWLLCNLFNSDTLSSRSHQNFHTLEPQNFRAFSPHIFLGNRGLSLSPDSLKPEMKSIQFAAPLKRVPKSKAFRFRRTQNGLHLILILPLFWRDSRLRPTLAPLCVINSSLCFNTLTFLVIYFFFFVNEKLG